jgi:hypothetical protein
MSRMSTHANSRDATQAGIQFGSFGSEPLSGEPQVVTRHSSSPGRRPVVLTAQAFNARGRSAAQSALADDEMLEPQVAATTVNQTTNQVHMADQFSDPTHAVTGQGPDGRVAGSSLGGTLPPRATGGRDLSADPTNADGKKTRKCGENVAKMCI